MNRRKRSIISGVLVLALSLGMVMNVNATTVDEAKKKAQELEDKKKSAEKEKNALADQLNTIINEMNEMKEKLNKKQSDIEKAENDLVQAKVDENDQYESMKKRIKFMYENGNSQLIEILLESDSIGDFLNKAEYVSQISAYDRDMLVQFQEIVKEVEEKEKALQEEYTELKGLQDSLIEKQNEVQALLEEKDIQISNLDKQIGENAATLEKLIKEAEAERQKQIQQQKAAEEAAKQAAAQQQAQNSGGGSSYVPPSSDNVVSGGGQFTHPCPGAVVSSTFGYRDFDGHSTKGLTWRRQRERLHMRQQMVL